ncbi:hypothetical protein Pst134EA_009846 [Puccinia striiformis f. sp. tritici]|uniref:Uncharacterized protein n=2 Tax=Puccinia striiformis TaxID=27350 RepID=A0A0L0V7E1_9BASI|nr:hypothetical protein Pst134EA_009846 [Puccinia striiformis f. sp. tritici]KAH9469324.1 hypothetical protein Pst134EA_009846 [Puccinia striiformis f. sp. tritici]KNE95188.1 hypothetical protein PSTG_11454 [Puccinia striiformis f. sp. tritici PST-78]POV96735.1 hypothetical protein PSTT_15450 [Puccinia striiformis]
MRFQPSRRLSITGSRSRSKPSLKWMPLVTGALLTVLYFDTKHTRVSYLANQQAGETFESSAPSDFKDSLERITNPYRVPGHPSPSGGLLKRTPQSPYTREPVTITEREDATVVNVTLRDNPIVINVEDEEDSTTHVITIIGFDENSQPIFETNKISEEANTISGSQSSIGVNSTTVVTATTTINTNPTTQVGVSHQIGFDTEGRKMLNLTALY